ncbi:mandelate racemase [Streptomyces clavuligerus]|uniref:mandelate racemase/muconate lactonizing enzyme family protein n=6 Tax=Streptomyces clavuligerus TaxID=1901 RepID=UPI00020D90E6|nr:enolase C-terminal domain-like protein [Streptomyces clavuligerus]AXU11745.1 mandelate racemase [Streptomyces clavuligerus]MBY6301584.1 mandelate racemase [Streptomyces clavuligerus]QCS04526.1 mandelate racemase [Streptomyces clavuligerus]QPJ96095.1 mandelate racemase [Streptomyces clavuligerus]QPL61859.1 mandelate racemase [Streptomyces clavuligerus]
MSVPNPRPGPPGDALPPASAAPLWAPARIERVETFAVALPAVRSFGISGGPVTVAGTPAIRVLVKVTAADGAQGWGEATPLPSWTDETAESIVTTIDRYLAPAVLGLPAWHLDAADRAFDRAVSRGFTIGAPLARSAVDMALNDLLGRAAGVPLGVLWGRRRCETAELGWIVSGRAPAEVADSVAEGLALGYRAFKVKIGLYGEEGDEAVVAAVREHAPPAAPIWVDANQAYTAQSALRMARRLDGIGISAFEQPLPANDIVGLRRLREHSPVPVALDESLRHPSDLATFVRLDAVDVAIAKVQRSGGLTLSRRLCSLAQECGVRLMGSGLTDSDLGLAASLHLFAAYGIDTPVDLNGRQFIESPYAVETVRVEGGKAYVPDTPGLGVVVNETVVRRLSVDVLERRV